LVFFCIAAKYLYPRILNRRFDDVAGMCNQYRKLALRRLSDRYANFDIASFRKLRGNPSFWANRLVGCKEERIPNVR